MMYEIKRYICIDKDNSWELKIAKFQVGQR